VLWAGARAGLPRAAVAVTAALGVATGVVRPPAVLVEFLPVGQGDAIIVKCGAHAALIDAGPEPEARVVRARLRLLGVDALDAVVATHAHPDHTGGLAATLRWFDVARVFAPADAHAPLVRATWTARTRAPLIDPGALSLPLGPTCALRFLPHDPPLRAEPNDTSLVARLDWPGGRALFTGDIEADAEARLVERHGAALRADVLKAPHHGSATSSTPTLLRAVSPRAVVFTTGVKNPWGFPREGIVDRYARRGVAWLDTARHGSVRLDADAEGAYLTPHRGPPLRVGRPRGSIAPPP
jgi:competence protein ComEC